MFSSKRMAMFKLVAPLFLLCQILLGGTPVIRASAQLEDLRHLAPVGECEILVYQNITEAPSIRNDVRGTCPHGGGSRAFLLETPANLGSGHLQHGSFSPRPAALKEVAPQRQQTFFCRNDLRCNLVVRGFGLGRGDAIIIQPVSGTDTSSDEPPCPPQDFSVYDPSDSSVVAQSERSAALASIRQQVPDASFAIFELPERYVLRPGNHTICYAPSLATQARVVDELEDKDFHYYVGTLVVGEELFKCTFEEAPPQSDGDVMDIVLPCGFKNFRDRWEADLVWRLNAGGTDTLFTGPSGDVTEGLAGKGHYVYMDSPGYAQGAASVIVSPPMAFSGGTYCAAFHYNMYGADVSTLRVYVHEVLMDIGNAASNGVNLLGDWGTPKWVAVGNKGDEWHRGGFEFKSSGLQTYQLVFQALAGTSEVGDIAIDEVVVTSGRCSEEIRSNMPKTIGNIPTARGMGSPLVCGEVRLLTGSDASDKSWYVDGAVSCAGRGYSLNELNQTAWLPCCVPHFGTYKLVLEDAAGDGWKGSRLEFRFFDRIVNYGDGEFQLEGAGKVYKLVIGSIEVTDILKPNDRSLDVRVRIARPNSYAWCGVVQAGRDGQPLAVSLTPAVLKKYGVRSKVVTAKENEELSIMVKEVLKQNSAYDFYCYSEVVGEVVDDDEASLERLKKEILQSRMRVTTDSQPPQLAIESVQESFNAINVSFTVDESSTVLCMADRTGASDFVSVAALLDEVTEDNEERMIRKIRSVMENEGFLLRVVVENPEEEVRHPYSVRLSPLIADTEYAVICYAEDYAEPRPNRMSAAQVIAQIKPVRTKAKVPHVKISRRTTLLKGFRLHVQSDAPGQVWCAAAPTDYGTPGVRDIVRVGASAVVDDPRKEAVLEVRGVEPSTPYIIYCVGGTRPTAEVEGADADTQDDGGRLLSTPEDMIRTAVTVVSYGKYCDVEVGPEVVTTTTEKGPFYPLSAAEEMKVREYILTRPELGLSGVYRITLLPNKTEIYDHLDKGGPMPKRFARVRAGRCVGNTGIYEQFRVGPIDGESYDMKYERIARPVETECGGYSPQGVFGRRLLGAAEDSHQATLEAFSAFLKKSFGFSFGTAECSAENESQSRAHSHSKTCLELGPVILEETCDGVGESHLADAERVNGRSAAPSASTESITSKCKSANRGGRVWVGLKTPSGVHVPTYFIYELADLGSATSSTRGGEQSGEESVTDWAKRIIREKELPAGFHKFWQAKEVWFDGHRHPTIESLLKAADLGSLPSYTPELLATRRRLVEEEIAKAAHEEVETRRRRRLAPIHQPFPGAAGTAGPLPTRQKRRGGLEYKPHPEHIEAQGKRFRIISHPDDEAFTIDYAGWNFTVSNDRDTSLRIYNTRFQGRKVAFEMGLMEALAHYSVSERNWFFLDSWYGGLGSAARRVHKGIECPKTGVSLFWDGSLCVFEQDLARPIRSHWKSGELRDGSPHTSLVLRQMLTVSNYDYLTDYRFHLNGVMEGTVAFTGELYAGIEVPWYSARQSDYGVQVTGAMRFAALHAHLAAWKVDFDIGDGDNYKRNSVLLSQVIADPLRPEAHKLKKTYAATEKDAAYFRNDTRTLVYEVVDETMVLFGNVGGYRVIPYMSYNDPKHHEYELYSGPAAWAKYRAFSTVHKYSELDSTLPRDNKHASKPAVSVDWYMADNEKLRNVDVVTWLSDGVFHLPIIEDMPLTVPIGNTLGWMAKPSNMFLEDPSMDLRNAMGGGLKDPGTCAVVRLGIGEVEATLEGTWDSPAASPSHRATAA